MLEIASWVRGYRREWLTFDLLAALALLAIVLPEQLATARLAGMPPVTGYFAFAAGSLMFALLGRNPQLSVGADSTIAPLFALGVAHTASIGSPRYLELVPILAVFTGVLVIGVWLLRLGWIAELLSAPIITGFLAGVAIVIVVHQLPDLLGLSAPSGSTLHRIGTIAGHLSSTRAGPLAVGAGVLVLVLGCERIDRRIPGALIALAVSTAAVPIFDLRAHGVAVLGTVAHGLPRFGLSHLDVHAIGQVAPTAVAVALVVVTQTAVTSRAFSPGATPGGAAVPRRSGIGRDFLGVGAGSVLAGVVGAFPVNASPPRTAAVAAARGRSQAAGLLAVAAVLALIPALGALDDLPLATLAGVLVFVAGRIFHARELRAIARFDSFELGLALITMLAVAVIGVEQGIAVAVGLAVLDRTRISARPNVHVLGRVPGTTSWARMSAAEPTEQLPGVLVVLFATSLWYANAVHFHAQLRHAIDAAQAPVHAVVLDVIGMNDIDYTGTRELATVLDELERAGIALAVARAGRHARESLTRSGLAERIGEDRFLATVQAAVDAVNGGRD